MEQQVQQIQMQPSWKSQQVAPATNEQNLVAVEKVFDDLRQQTEITVCTDFASLGYNNLLKNQLNALVFGELFSLEARLSTDEALAKWVSTNQKEIIVGFKWALMKGLSLDKSNNEVYIYTQTKGKLSFQATAKGELKIALKEGKIIGYKYPEVEYNNKNQVDRVHFEFQLPYGGWHKVTYGYYDFQKWINASLKKNGQQNGANPLYTSYNGWIDPKFAQTKAIKHALSILASGGHTTQGIPQMPAEQPLRVTPSIAGMKNIVGNAPDATHTMIEQETYTL